MAQEIVLGITLKADGSGLKGEIAGISQEVRAQEPLWKSLATSMGLVNLATALLQTGLSKVRQAFDFVRDSVNDAARYQTLGVAMNQVGKNAGYTAGQMAGFEAELRKNGIAMLESRQTLTQMSAAHIDLSKATELARVAQDAAVIGNINSSEAFARMIYGIQSGQVEVLRTIGINVNFESSYERLARKLGINAALLTENEKAQARQNAVLAAGPAISGAYEAAMGTAGKQLSSMKRYLDDLSVKMGTGFLEAFTQKVFGQVDSLKKLGQEMDTLLASGKVDEWGHSLADVVVKVSDVAKAAWQMRDAILGVGIAYAGAKIGSWLGPIVTQTYAAAAANVQFYSSVAAGNTVMLGGATASRQKATAEAAAAAASLAHAEAVHAVNVAVREQQIATLAAANAQFNAASAMGSHSAALAAVNAASATRTQAVRQLADVSRVAAATEAELASATAAHHLAQGNLARTLESTTVSARAAAAAKTALSGVVTALGGPIGVIITALTLGAAAWMAFGNSGKDAMQDMSDRAKTLEERLVRVNKELKYGGGEKGDTKEKLAQARADMAKAREQYQASHEYLAQNVPAYQEQMKAEADALAILDGMKKRAAGVGEDDAVTGKSSGRFTQMAAQYGPKPKMADTLALLNRERDEELRLAGDSAEKKADIERTYQRTRKGIIEQMGGDSHRALAAIFDREIAATKESEKERLLNIDTSHRIGLLNDQDYIAAKLAVENDYLNRSEAILQRKLAASKDAAEKEKVIGELSAISQQRSMAALAAESEQKILRGTQTGAIASWTAQQNLANDALSFETELLGQDTFAQEKARAAREIDLAVRGQIMEAYLDENGQLAWRLKVLPEIAEGYLKAGDAAKAARDKALEDKDAKSRDWTTGASDALNEYLRTASDGATAAKTLFSDMAKGTEDMFVKMATTGKASIKDLVQTALADLARIYYRDNYAKPIAGIFSGMTSGIGSLFGKSSSGSSLVETGGTSLGDMIGIPSLGFAKGDVFNSPSLHSYVNGVYDRPQMFAFAQGGVFAEAGPEGVFPLKRDSQGNLGVIATGGGGLQNLRVQIINEGSSQQRVTSVQPSFDADGYVVQVFLNDMRNNGPMRQGMSMAGIRGA